MKVITAPLGGLIGAMIGGVLWANYIQWTGNTAGFVALGIGVLSGIGIILTGSRSLDTDNQKHWLYLAIAAALFSIFGVFVGKYLDVQFNAISQMTEQILAGEPQLSEQAATSIAETQYSGSSKWELIKQRMDWFDLVYVAIAVAMSVYITLNVWIRKLLSN